MAVSSAVPPCTVPRVLGLALLSGLGILAWSLRTQAQEQVEILAQLDPV